ncbi:hypothetical protein NP233_g9821 [Leucocoprinus birnbaumii]|uniref:Uncharacterized protein n=1 Tax=Leucocoprinus birnbaumii TaxID=56174 RepID=A0AAD5YQH4_9AGAR|nr:hypothetical protein NP233_g9821 [Leucocoprinus birnbaumii]
MLYDATSIHNHLMHQNNYLACPGFDSQKEMKDPYKPATCTVVGIVEKDWLNVTLIGNYNPQYNPLSGAKFQLTLNCPLHEKEFRADWTTALAILKKLQSVGGKTSSHQFLTQDNKTPPALRLSAPIFKKVDPGSHADESDFPTSDWPVLAEYAEALQDIADSHCVLPLVVYDENEAFIMLEDVQGVLAGALLAYGPDIDPDDLGPSSSNAEVTLTHPVRHPYTNLWPILKIATSPPLTQNKQHAISPAPAASCLGAASSSSKWTSSGTVKTDVVDNQGDGHISTEEYSDGETLDGYSIIAVSPSPNDSTQDCTLVEDAGVKRTYEAPVVEEPSKKRTRTTKGKGKAN